MVHLPRQITFILAVLLIATNVISKPTEPRKETEDISAKIAVAQLGKLRQQKGNTIFRTSQEHVSFENGKKVGTKQEEEIIKDSVGKLVSDLKQKAVTSQNGAKKPSTVIKTDIEIPQENIHKSYVQTAPKSQVKRKKSQKQMSNSRQRIEFNPLELAKYIDDTGDEEGIVLAINELIEDGMLSREQALGYLQRIKMALQMMQTSEEQHGNALNEIRRPIKVREMNEDYQMRSSEYAPTEEEQELMGKLQVADYLYREYEMEVIYQLFKDLFKKKLIEGDVKDVQTAVERLAALIENEKQFGKISEELEAEILETMTSAMVASLAENKREALWRFSSKEDMGNELSKHGLRNSIKRKKNDKLEERHGEEKKAKSEIKITKMKPVKPVNLAM